jgi:hypothetical protein
MTALSNRFHSMHIDIGILLVIYVSFHSFHSSATYNDVIDLSLADVIDSYDIEQFHMTSDVRHRIIEVSPSECRDVTSSVK